MDIRGPDRPSNAPCCLDLLGFFLGFGLGWIPALILALLVVVATIFLWPLAAVAVLYVIYRVFGVHRWFAWRPVFISNRAGHRRLVWFRFVERTWTEGITSGLGPRWVYWKVRTREGA